MYLYEQKVCICMQHPSNFLLPLIRESAKTLPVDYGPKIPVSSQMEILNHFKPILIGCNTSLIQRINTPPWRPGKKNINLRRLWCTRHPEFFIRRLRSRSRNPSQVKVLDLDKLLCTPPLVQGTAR